MQKQIDEVMGLVEEYKDVAIGGFSGWDERMAIESKLRELLPEGFSLVPIEPTDDMEVAAENDYELKPSYFPDWKSAWRAMLAAAPKATE